MKRECGQMASELQRDLYLKKFKKSYFRVLKSLKNTLDVVNDVHHKVQNRNIKFFVFGLHKKGKD
jgi:hypothetical protein